jgi:hypothetical protein
MAGKLACLKSPVRQCLLKTPRGEKLQLNTKFVGPAMSSLVSTIAALGFTMAYLLLLRARRFVRNQGFKVDWLAPTYWDDWKHLRSLTTSSDQMVAREAAVHLRLQVVAWVMFGAFGVFFFALM